MKRAATVIGLACLWTGVASAVFCAFDFRLFRFPWMQWWVGLYYLRNMLWLPRTMRDFGHWPLFWFIAAAILASLLVSVLAPMFLGQLWPRRNRQPILYGKSWFAGEKDKRAGGILTERRR